MTSILQNFAFLKPEPVFEKRMKSQRHFQTRSNHLLLFSFFSKQTFLLILELLTTNYATEITKGKIKRIMSFEIASE